MPDWNEYVRRNLALPELTREREEQIREDLARQFEQAYSDALARGAVGEEAKTAARAHVPDWESFISDVYRSERRNVKARLDRWSDQTKVHTNSGGVMSSMTSMNRWLSDFRQDVVYGLRSLRKSPGFTIVAVLTLALGIGANTAIFSVVDTVLFRPLPYEDSSRIVTVLEHDVQRGERRSPISPAAFHFWRERARSFEETAAATPWTPVLTGWDRPHQMQGMRAFVTLFRLLGVAPHLGRTFQDEDGEPGNERVVVLGHALWQRQFGGNPSIVGQNIQLDGTSYTIIGVMPPDFRFPTFWFTEAEFWAPLIFSPAQRQSKSRHLRLFARLKPGVSIEEARTEMSVLAGQLEAIRPRAYPDLAVNVEPLHESTVHNVREALLVLLGAVSFVLLIACANVANLLLVRGSSRRRELAVRVALGAERARLVRQMLTESLLLGAAGGAAGLFLAYWGLSALMAVAADSLPRLEEIALDTRVLLFALGLSTVTALIAGLAPAWQVSKVSLNESLQMAGRQSAAGRSRIRHAFVVIQVALALVLLTGAGLLLYTLQNLQTFDPGFARSNVLTAYVSLAGSRHASPERQNPFFDDLLSRVRALPVVESAGLVNHLPFGGDIWRQNFTVDGEPVLQPENLPNAVFRVATPGYFRAMDIRLLRGRDLTEEDTAMSPPVVIVNETFAQRFLPGDDPIGRRIRLGRSDSTDVWRTVVGIIGDTRQWELTREPRPEFHFPYSQNPASWWAVTTLAVRSAADVPTLARAIEMQVHAIDPSLPVSHVRTMEQILDIEVQPQRLNGVLVGIFAALALVLTAVGIYGVIAFAVAQRTQEIGVRMALGAQPGNILRLIVGQGLSLLLLGVGLGLLASFVLTRVLESFLFGISARDPIIFGGVALLLCVVALLACWVPARRASKMDPMVALRYE